MSDDPPTLASASGEPLRARAEPAVLPYRDRHEDRPPGRAGDIVGLVVSVGCCLFMLLCLIVLMQPLARGYYWETLPLLAICLVGLWLSSLTTLTYLGWLRRGHPPNPLQ